jgi:predicted  nucleic acid-binding Zn-ribbon protein
MKELTVQDLKDKIKKVQEDMKTIPNEKGREALVSYLEYLKDELSMLENKNGKLQS